MSELFECLKSGTLLARTHEGARPLSMVFTLLVVDSSSRWQIKHEWLSLKIKGITYVFIIIFIPVWTNLHFSVSTWLGYIQKVLARNILSQSQFYPNCNVIVKYVLRVHSGYGQCTLCLEKQICMTFKYRFRLSASKYEFLITYDRCAFFAI